MKVFVECYNDSALVLSLGIPIRQLGHEFNKVNVLRRLSQFEGDAVGVIDADTGKLHSGYPAEMAKYLEREKGYRLTRMVHGRNDRKSVVIIDPTLEEWLYARANDCKLQLTRYGLPPSASAMHKMPRYDRKPDFSCFLADLRDTDNGMKMLGKWLGR